MDLGEERNCPRCGRANDHDASNCIRCGLDFSQGWEVGPGPEAEAAAFCFRHPKAPTSLSCGRCERPICTKCAVIGANGIRCRECAKQTIEFRPAALGHEVKRGLGSLVRVNPFMIWILVSLIGSVFYMMRSCSMRADHGREPPAVESQE